MDNDSGMEGSGGIKMIKEERSSIKRIILRVLRVLSPLSVSKIEFAIVPVCRGNNDLFIKWLKYSGTRPFKFQLLNS